MNTANIYNILMAADGIKPIGERLADGLQVFVVGILAVFVVLACLWGVLALFKVFFYDIPEKKKAESKITTEQSKIAQVTVDEKVAEPAVTVQDDSQLIAVITAAIAAYNAENGKVALPFRVVSYKRVRGANGWNGADENETV